MSYCRIGDDSDVYVWADGTQIWVSISMDVMYTDPSMPVGVDTAMHPRAGAVNGFTDRQVAYEYLTDLLGIGFKVPDEVFIRMWNEIDDLGPLVGVKKRKPV